MVRRYDCETYESDDAGGFVLYEDYKNIERKYNRALKREEFLDERLKQVKESRLFDAWYELKKYIYNMEKYLRPDILKPKDDYEEKQWSATQLIIKHLKLLEYKARKEEEEKKDANTDEIQKAILIKARERIEKGIDDY